MEIHGDSFLPRYFSLFSFGLLYVIYLCIMWWQLDVIGIDEAQFFGDLYDFCREAADHDGKTVIVAGLDGDYLRYY